MKPEFEPKLRRDARSIEEDAPAGMFARVRDRMERASTGEVTAARSNRRTLLVAAGVIVVAGAALWIARASRGQDRTAPNPEPVATSQDPARFEPTAFPLGTGLRARDWPSEGIEMATRAGEPLAREWERVKSDSMTLLRGFERQIPRL